jgi:energy-coupling factor transporter ATP-binding protein EcfA2
MSSRPDAVFPWKNVLDNVSDDPLFRGMPKTEATGCARGWIQRVGLAGFEHYYPYQLSGGVRKRLGLAQSLITGPQIPLLAEPFIPLDVQTRTLMEDEPLNIWSSTSAIVVFVTHDLEEAIAPADRVVVLTAGPGMCISESGLPAVRGCDALEGAPALFPGSRPASISRAGYTFLFRRMPMQLHADDKPANDTHIDLNGLLADTDPFGSKPRCSEKARNDPLPQETLDDWLYDAAREAVARVMPARKISLSAIPYRMEQQGQAFWGRRSRRTLCGAQQRRHGCRRCLLCCVPQRFQRHRRFNLRTARPASRGVGRDIGNKCCWPVKREQFHRHRDLV